MTLEKLGAGIDFVSDTTPAASDAIDGDVYLDTSLSPPQVKVFDATAGSFVAARVGVDWESKTPRVSEATGSTGSVTVNGSGYITGIAVSGFANSALARLKAELSIDGSTLGTCVEASANAPDDPMNASMGSIHRFESSFDVSITRSDDDPAVYVSYELD
jgi:hypothetical protein